MGYYQISDQLYFFLNRLLVTVCMYSCCHPNKTAYVKVFRATCFINRYKFYSWSFCCFLCYSNIYHWESIRFSLQLKLVLRDNTSLMQVLFPYSSVRTQMQLVYVADASTDWTHDRGMPKKWVERDKWGKSDLRNKCSCDQDLSYAAKTWYAWHLSKVENIFEIQGVKNCFDKFYLL